jgi:hypothetical protein
MTRFSLAIEGSAHVSNLIDFAQRGVGWRKFNQRREAYRKRVQRRSLKVLGTYPGPRRGKFRFATERSRRWFFANYPEGYTRTGQLGESWRVKMSVTVAGFSMEIGTDADAAQYVYGGEQFRQVPGHFDTGWPNADDQFLDVAAYAEKELIREIDALIEEAL